jgi:hypothetical protein
MLGCDVLAEWGGVVNLHQGKCEFVELGQTVGLLRMNEWRKGCAGGGVNYVMNVYMTKFKEVESKPDFSLGEAKSRLQALLAKHKEVFEEPCGAAVDPVVIRLKEDKRAMKPINMPPRRRPTVEQKIIEKETSEELRLGVIEEGRGPWNFRNVVVDKSNGEHRKCVNFFPLNKRLEPYKYPLPKMDDILAGMGGKKVFSNLDLARAFQQIPVAESSRDLLSFTTRRGKWRYKVLPYGIAIATEVMQETMVNVCSGKEGDEGLGVGDLLWLVLAIYVDDLFLYTMTRRAHLLLLDILFARLRKFRFRLRREKCKFMVKEVKALGFFCF